MNFDAVCDACKAGMHDECYASFLTSLGDDEECCCGGKYTLADHAMALIKEQAVSIVEGGSTAPKKKVDGITLTAPSPEEKNRGDSGYIHPDAWPSTRDIGTMRGLPSTGRKRAKKMYPTPIGHKCEWAGLAAAGGGVYPIVGCLGNPATDLHHGPDKNTLNNERVSDGIGNAQNVHLICSDCHNAWHAKNNPTYPHRDFDADQEKPWLPMGVVQMHDAETVADDETLYAVDRERKKARAENERHTSGRGDRTFTGGDFDIDDDELDIAADAGGE